MPLFVQLEAKGEPLWHTVESYDDARRSGSASSMEFARTYKTGCGLTIEAPAHRMIEAESPPWTNRHVKSGCFDSAQES